MKLFLIKIGKAWSVIKRDGVINGGKRVVAGMLAMFQCVRKGDTLFIAGGVGDSARYRTNNVAEELDMKGFKCSITVQDSPFLISYAGKFKVFIFHRTIFTSRVKKFIEEIKKQKKEIIFDTDDLVYDSKFLKNMDYLKNINKLEKKLYEKGVGEEIVDDSHVKTCTVTTSYLAEKLREKNKRVIIVPNRLSRQDVEWADEILENKNTNPMNSSSGINSPLTLRGEDKPSSKKIKLGYFSGTISHNKDFAAIKDALIEVMERHENVELFLIGPLDLENELIERFKDRIVQLPFVPRKKHLENISKADINLSPLELGNPFCEAKSELKFFEAGIMEVPTVAIRNQTFSEAINDGVDGSLANGTEEWIEKLEKLIVDGDLRKSMGKKAREKTLKRYTTINANNEEYYSYLRSRIKSSS